MDGARDFGTFEGKTWIHCSHKGALQGVAVEAAEEAIRWKQAPHNSTSDRFTEVPAALRQTLAQLIGAAPEDVVEGELI